MAIKIQCSECGKKISIDEAFAGGVCRCPYCRAIVMVPGDATGGSGGSVDRPSAPPSRPAESPEPTATPAESSGALSQSSGALSRGSGALAQGSGALAQSAAPPQSPAIEQSAPVEPTASTPTAPPQSPAIEQVSPAAPANRVKVLAAVGVIAVLLLSMIVGVIALAVSDKNDDGGNMSAGPVIVEENPYEAGITGPVVANNVRIRTPVIYVLDGGSSMNDMFDPACGIARASVRSLGSTDKFNLIVSLSGDGAATTSATSASANLGLLEASLRVGGEEGERKVQEYLEKLIQEVQAPVGKTDILAALDAAIAMKPRTIVVFTRSDLTDVGGNALDKPAAAVVERARKADIAIVTIAMDVGNEATMRKTNELIAKGTGAECRAYSHAQLDDWYRDFLKQEDEKEDSR